MDTYPIFLFILICFIPLGIGLIVVLGIRGLPLSMRGIQSAIQMDNAIFLKTDEGNITIKRRTFYIWLIITVLGVFEIGLLAAAISVVANIVRGKDISVTITSGIILGPLFLGYVLFQNIQSLHRPSIIHINTNSRTILIGRGSTKEQILFSQISQILGIDYPTPGTFFNTKIGIRLILDSGKEIELGSVSGERNKVHSRATAIAQQIAEVTGTTILSQPKS